MFKFVLQWASARLVVFLPTDPEAGGVWGGVRLLKILGSLLRFPGTGAVAGASVIGGEGAGLARARVQVQTCAAQDPL